MVPDLRGLPFIRTLAEAIRRPGETLQEALCRIDAMPYCDLVALHESLQQKAEEARMGWNYRVVKETLRGPGSEPEDDFSIREVYYEKGGDGPVRNWTGPMAPAADSPDDLRVILQRMMQALDKPVLVKQVDEDGAIRLVELQDKKEG